MRVLAIETSGVRGGIALADWPGSPDPGPGAGARLLDEVRLAEGLRHGRDLILAAKQACDRAAWDPRRIDLVAVSIGPGSFTGIRIAVTLAKFLAWDTAAKVVAVPTFRALAENAPPDRRRIATIVDANRGGLFAAIFERRDMDPRRSGSGGLLTHFDEVFGPALIEPDALARRLQVDPPSLPGRPPAYVLGHGIAKARLALAAFDLAPENLWDVRPAVIAQLGCELAARGQFADPLRLEPLYIRLPEAQEIWDQRHKNA